MKAKEALGYGVGAAVFISCILLGPIAMGMFVVGIVGLGIWGYASGNF